MPSLFDMLSDAQNGQAIETLARQFNLSQQQTQSALEALLPAFSQGLKRNAADPHGMAAFMSAVGSGQYARYFEDASRAAAPEGMADGNGVLGQIFGSKELSRAVAAQAAQATGIGQEVLKQMLPVIASMLMGGFFKQVTGQMSQAGAANQNPFGQLIEQMMRQGGMAQTPHPGREAPAPFDNPFGKALQEMFGQSGREARRGAQPNLQDNPLGGIFQDMLSGGQTASQPEQPSRENPSGRPRNPYDDLFGDMFETGRRQQEGYQREMESIFDRFLKGMEKHRPQ